RDGGAVGMTIDSDSEILFITFEFSGTLDIVDAKTMTRLGQVMAPGASNLAGIVYDHDKKKMYCVDRGTTHLYVYDWDAATQTLTLEGGAYKTLPGTYAYGIALDETRDILYVANYSQTVRYFDTAIWTEQGNFTITPSSIGIAVDETNNLVYSGGFYSTISKYDMNTATETTATTTYAPIGFAVDQSTGLLYVTYYSNDRLRVFDSDFTEHWCSGDLGNPTGLCVPRSEVHYNPLNLSKADDADPVSACDILTYTICFDNFLNPTNAVDNVVITDEIPNNVSYISASVDEGTATFDGTTVTWDFGTVAAGAGPYCMELVVEVTGLPGDVILNTCYIDSAIGGTHVTETTDIVVFCGDLDHDGDVDGDDRTIFIGALRTCTGDLGFIEEADYDFDGCITYNDYREWYKCYKAYLNSF
ncbi:MAG: DUF11 domain-containing protein, partial [Desulfobulbaceae bacterium]|nr:DUF11 domain-containing protein [Desulfobulbaceae bacterium]